MCTHISHVSGERLVERNASSVESREKAKKGILCVKRRERAFSSGQKYASCSVPRTFTRSARQNCSHDRANRAVKSYRPPGGRFWLRAGALHRYQLCICCSAAQRRVDPRRELIAIRACSTNTMHLHPQMHPPESSELSGRVEAWREGLGSQKCRAPAMQRPARTT